MAPGNAGHEDGTDRNNDKLDSKYHKNWDGIDQVTDLPLAKFPINEDRIYKSDARVGEQFSVQSNVIHVITGKISKYAIFWYRYGP